MKKQQIIDCLKNLGFQNPTGVWEVLTFLNFKLRTNIGEK